MTTKEVATRREADAPARITTIEQVFRSEAFKQQVALALPRHISADSMMRIAMTQLRLVPKLDKCSVESFMGALLQASQVGLRPGVLGEAHLIPRWSSKTKTYEACFQPGYQGVAQLAFRSGEIADLSFEPVYRGDTFSVQKGEDPKIIHIPDPDNEPDEANLTHVYAIVKLKSGGILRAVMTRKQIDAVRDRYAQRDRDTGNLLQGQPWVTDYIAMALKTVLLRALKLAPKSTELQMVIDASYEADNPAYDRGRSGVVGTAAQRVAARLGAEPEDAEVVDENGEIVNEKAGGQTTLGGAV